MSSDGFEVDLGALGAARDQVGRIAAELSEPQRVVPSADVFGHGRLAKAVNEFAAKEEVGVSGLAGEAESIRSRLAETIRTYRDADEDSAGRLGSIA
ncbi:MAG: hypothetical protein WBA97_08160 [Actinophytocola sp.]|uniref:hypothetical protein n=1 Tax=Actinophytocola sp. TaxID=1872138 RepID=UPI003C7260C5